MKKVTFLFVFVLILANTVNAQKDLVNKLLEQADTIHKLSRSKDSLTIVIKNLLDEKVRFISEIKRLKVDSSKLANIKPQIEQLNNLQKEVEQLCKDTIGNAKLKNDQIQLRLVRENITNSISEINGLRGDINKCKDKNLIYLRTLDYGVTVIRVRYQNSFDALTEILSEDDIDNDIKLLKILDIENSFDTKLAVKMNDILLYKRAERLLTQKYSGTKISDAILALRSISTNENVKQLINSLEYYDVLNMNLKSVIKEIQEKNKLKTFPNRDLMSDKKDKTLRMIEDYIFELKVDLVKYSYLNSIINELKIRKMKDIDSDVQDILLKL